MFHMSPSICVFHGELLTLQYIGQWPMGLLGFLPCPSAENLNQSLGITWPSIHTSETMPMSSHKGLGLCQSHLRITEVACDLDYPTKPRR